MCRVDAGPSSNVGAPWLQYRRSAAEVKLQILSGWDSMLPPSEKLLNQQSSWLKSEQISPKLAARPESGWRMWRIVGARKANSPSSCMMPVNTQYQRKHYFYQHIMTVLEGDEFDLSAHFVRAMELDSDAPETYVVTAANKRKALSMLATDSERAMINERVVNAARPRANYLEPYNDSQLRTKAAAALEELLNSSVWQEGTTCQYKVIRNAGGRMSERPSAIPKGDIRCSPAPIKKPRKPSTVWGGPLEHPAIGVALIEAELAAYADGQGITKDAATAWLRSTEAFKNRKSSDYKIKKTYQKITRQLSPLTLVMEIAALQHQPLLGAAPPVWPTEPTQGSDSDDMEAALPGEETAAASALVPMNTSPAAPRPDGPVSEAEVSVLAQVPGDATAMRALQQMSSDISSVKTAMVVTKWRLGSPMET
ncbi:hypothetical protein WJX82_006244 [Trebouxia sp. C0006]